MIRLLLLIMMLGIATPQDDTSGVLLEPACYKYHKDGAAILQIQQENDHEFGRKNEGDPRAIVFAFNILTGKYMWARHDIQLYRSDEGWIELEEEERNQTLVYHPIARCPGYFNSTEVEERASLAARIVPPIAVVSVVVTIVTLVLLFLTLFRLCHESRLLVAFDKWQRNRKEYDLLQRSDRLAVNDFVKSLNNIGEKQQLLFEGLLVTLQAACSKEEHPDISAIKGFLEKAVNYGSSGPTVPVPLKPSIRNLTIPKPPKAKNVSTFQPTPEKTDVTTPLMNKDTDFPPPPPPEALRLDTIAEVVEEEKAPE